MTASSARRARESKRRAKALATQRPGPLRMFFKGFMKRPVMVGAIVPSSRVVISRVLKPVDWANTKLFVEYGPGVGTFCQPILDRLVPDATLLVIDTNPDFIGYLRETIADPRFVAVEGSAADVASIIAEHGFAHADYVLSGLPFSTLPKGVGAAIGQATYDVLRPGGAFLVYQYTPKCRQFIAPYFERIDHGMEVVNIPPAQLYWAWKD